jgi:Domain of unknown function (DUF1707)
MEERRMADERRAPRPLSFPLDDIRPSDAEREEVVEQLRYHAEQGRLDMDELSERLDRVYAAKARRELADQLSELPVPPPEPAPAPTRTGPPDAGSYDTLDGLMGRFRGYLAVSVLLVAIWALAGAGTFWPIWFIVFGAIGVVTGGRRRRHGMYGHGRYGMCGDWGHGMCGHGRHGRQVPVRVSPPLR